MDINAAVTLYIQGHPVRLSPLLKRMLLARSLRGRLLLGLAATWFLVVTLVLGMSWQLGKTMVQETNMAHLRYEATLLADEVSQQVELRFQALERLREMIGTTEDAGWISYQLQQNDSLLAWFEGIVVANSDGEVIADWRRARNR